MYYGQYTRVRGKRGKKTYQPNQHRAAGGRRAEEGGER